MSRQYRSERLLCRRHSEPIVTFRPKKDKYKPVLPIDHERDAGSCDIREKTPVQSFNVNKHSFHTKKQNSSQEDVSATAKMQIVEQKECTLNNTQLNRNTDQHLGSFSEQGIPKIH